MSYADILTTFGVSQSQIELLMVGGVILTIVGFILFLYWQYILMGVVAFGVLTIVMHHPSNKVEEIVEKEEVIEPVVAHDPNMQKTAFDPFLLFSLLRFRAEQAQAVTPAPAPEPVAVKEVVETEEMRQYVKNCTELTNDSKLCRDNWVAANENGMEIILDPVERPNKPANTTKVVKVKATKQAPVSQVKEVKLLDVDNEEYKARRATAMAKPNAIVFQETVR
jgi:hypothetical protein